MSAGKPILVILGATGNQGGSVITHFLSLSPSPYALRAVTRDISSAKAKLLASQGVEVVTGNFDDPQSLDAAFSGASVIFSVTDFLQSMLNPSLHEKAAAAGISTGFYIRDYEAQQNRHIIDAAAKVSTLERFIYSSLPYANKLSGGKYEHVYYYDSKAAAEEYGKATYPELWEKTSVFYAGFYLENYVWEAKVLFAPKLVCSCLQSFFVMEYYTDDLIEQREEQSFILDDGTSHHFNLPLVLRRTRYRSPRGSFDKRATRQEAHRRQ
jgi:hypothetical protein